MKLLNQLYSTHEDDLFIVSQSLLNHYNIKHSDLHLRNLLQDHIDYPSLLTIKDTLSEYGIESVALRKGNHNYFEFETPFICSIQKEAWTKPKFTLVSEIDESHITYLDPQTRIWTQIGLSDFELLEKGVILLTESSNKKDELNLSTNLIHQRNRRIFKLAPLYILIITTVFYWVYSIFGYQEGITWANIVYSLTGILGILVSSLLILHDIDAHNPIFREVCGGNGKKLHCDAVLNSNHSTFLGISWSVWGFSFMATLFTIQIFFPGQLFFLYISSYLSIIAAPYILFSIYYQAKVIRQWCSLCMTVQLLLLINFLAAVFFINYNRVSSDIISFYSLTLTALILASYISASFILIPIFKNSRQTKITEKRWRKLKYNPAIFQALLNKSDKITVSTDGLGVTIGNPNAKNEIIKVCNPYCGPCANAHPELDTIVRENPDVKIRIIFTATGEESDRRTPPVLHFLAIQELRGSRILNQALDDWYLAKDKNYQIFAEKYPLNGEQNNQKEKVKEMMKWCNTMKIRATPTIFINGSELPEDYLISELKNFF
ncbi:thioredoxin domain-containing protein [Sphingobacterium daejeonense]|uniref:vitamin K epoxide reductase family protein n=1 Tax=Sphingobacterium daejeonense TaxID=371142 RepID=UPI0021A28ED2|nr:vitamin K epoxide reductase family protein [Sphingobacterium daejeonense]MCT1531941.1 thioredoxin domain-containing protein [Sphingobacterium daejeonense]